MCIRDSYCIGGFNGTVIWSKSLRGYLNVELINVYHPCTVVDVNNDGILDIMLVSTIQNETFLGIKYYIMAIDGKTGELIYAKNIKLAQVIVVGDLNNDETPEIIITYVGGVLLLNSNFSVIQNITLPGQFPDIEGVAIGDINNDGLNEIIVTTFDFHVFAINYYGEILWCSKLEWPPWLTHPILADINDDGILDVIVVGFHHLFYALNGIDGSLIMKYNTSERLPNTPCAADLDGDGLIEIAFASEQSLYILQTNGTKYFWYSFMGDCRNCGNAMMLVDPFFNPFT